MKTQKRTPPQTPAVPSAHQLRADEAQANADRAQQFAEDLHRQRDAAGQELEAAHKKRDAAHQTVRDAIAAVPVAEEKVVAAQQRAEDARARAAKTDNPDTRKWLDRSADDAGRNIDKARAKADAAKRWVDQAKQLAELAGQQVAQVEAKHQRLTLAAAESQRHADEAARRG